MLHISLFSGIGGFDLASEWMGWQNIASCEINPFGRKVLEYYWPNAYHHDDIKTLTYEKINEELTARFGHNWRSDDIILTGGFPCQPYSSAGKRLGKEDERHLWPEMLRAIREIEPTFIVGENVRGLLNWNGGLVFDEVCADLESLGYQVAPCLIPACATDAPHKRERIWFVAHSKSHGDRGRIYGMEGKDGSDRQSKERGQDNDKYRNNGKEWDATNANRNGLNGSDCQHEEQPSEGGEYAQRDIGESHDNGITTNPISIGHPGRTETTGNDNAERIGRMDTDCGRNGDEIRGEVDGCGGVVTDTELCANRVSTKRGMDVERNLLEGRKREEKTNGFNFNNSRPNFDKFPTQSPICTRNDGLSTRLDGITFSKWRNESIKAGGNAIVPQVAYQIFKAIEQYEHESRNNI